MADQKIDTAIVIGAKAREIERDHQPPLCRFPICVCDVSTVG
jgi:hypothetical protein